LRGGDSSPPRIFTGYLFVPVQAGFIVFDCTGISKLKVFFFFPKRFVKLDCAVIWRVGLQKDFTDFSPAGNILQLID
jgi:hypothetical protein